MLTMPRRDASSAPEPPLPPGHRASGRHDLRAGAAAAPWRPRLRAMRAARRSRRRPLDTAPPWEPPARRNRWRRRSFRPFLKIPRPRAWVPPVRAHTLRHPWLAAFKSSATVRPGAFRCARALSGTQLQCASACPQSAGFARVPRVARSAPRQQPAPVGAGTLRPLPAAGAGPSLAPPPEIRRAPGRQQRARLVLAVAPPAGALSARLPLASLFRALRAHKGAALRLRRNWRARCARAHLLRATAARGGLWPADGRPARPLRAASCCPPMAGSAGPLPAPHRLTNGSADELH